jgi:putative intracellular protease/amidase
MKVLVVLYEGFTEYEYAIPLLAMYHYQIPFHAVGCDSLHPAGMIGLTAHLSQTLDDVRLDDYDTLLLPGVDREKRDEAIQNAMLTALLRQYHH